MTTPESTPKRVLTRRPDNWDKMGEAEKRAWAKAYIASLRSKN